MKYFTSVLIILDVLASFAHADVTTYTNFQSWQSGVGYDNSAIDFVGWPQFTFITEQYADKGIHFIDGNDFAWLSQHFPDGAGLVSGADDDFGIGMSFDIPQYHVGFDFVGIAQVILLQRGEVIYTSWVFDDSISTFAGVISTKPFDRAILIDPSDPVVVIDNLYFGPPIPAPGALGIFALAMLIQRQRRRS